jgi:hypothetical protein
MVDQTDNISASRQVVSLLKCGERQTVPHLRTALNDLLGKNQSSASEKTT